MGNRDDGERRSDGRMARSADERRCLVDERDYSGWRPQGHRERDSAQAHPGREWAHERSSGSRAAGESYGRSPRRLEPERYGYGSGSRWPEDRYEREQREFGRFNEPSGESRAGALRNEPRRHDHDDRHNWRDSPAAFGEQSYGGYGDLAGPEYESVRMENEGYGQYGGESGYGREPVDPSRLTVDVRDGEVTIEGLVESRTMKRDAEDLAAEVPGVKQVHNRLRVQTADASPVGGREGTGEPRP